MVCTELGVLNGPKNKLEKNENKKNQRKCTMKIETIDWGAIKIYRKEKNSLKN